MEIFRLAKTWYIVRGALTAFSLITLLPQVLPFEARDIIGGIHFLVVQWNVVAEAIGKFFADLFGLTPVPHEIVTGLALALGIGPFYSKAIYEIDKGKFNGAVQRGAFGTRILMATVSIILMATVSIILMSLFLVASPVGHLLF